MKLNERGRGILTLAAAVWALTSANGATAAETAEKQSGADIQLPSPPDGKGQVVFFRKGGLSGSAVACSVHENGEKVSSLGGGRYFIMVAAPGRHEFSVKTEATDVLALEVESDETQFASCKIKMGVMVGRPDIKPATEDEFRKMKSLKLVDDDDMGPGPGALRSADVAAALAGGGAAASDTSEAEAASAPDEESAPADDVGEDSAE